MTLIKSDSYLTEFNPQVIPWQWQAIKAWNNFDYSKGTHEIMYSGSVGSAKSILAAHQAIVHCLQNPKARVLLGRKALPDLKATIYQKITEHIEPCLREGIDYYTNTSTAFVKFKNGSEIISRSWSDRKYKKVRSLELSGAIIEEASENEDDEKEIYTEIKMRLGRLPHIKQNFIICCTNPDSPSHWLYKYFIESNSPTRHVFYSITTDNPFLPPQYINQLKEDLDPKMAERMIYGKWIEIAAETIYHAYKKENNFRNKSFTIMPGFPVSICFDFNIGLGKPMSACAFQFINGTFHIFQEWIVEGANTSQMCDEIAASGILEEGKRFHIHGDATGKARSTKSIHSDYDIITKFFSNYKLGSLDWKMNVPNSNPPIRKRHNIVNSYCENALGQHRMIVYKDCPTLDEGLRLVSFKKGGQLIEDDSKSYQHVTTALGYGMVWVHNTIRNGQNIIEFTKR